MGTFWRSILHFSNDQSYKSIDILIPKRPKTESEVMKNDPVAIDDQINSPLDRVFRFRILEHSSLMSTIWSASS